MFNGNNFSLWNTLPGECGTFQMCLIVKEISLTSPVEDEMDFDLRVEFRDSRDLPLMTIISVNPTIYPLNSLGSER